MERQKNDAQMTAVLEDEKKCLLFRMERKEKKRVVERR